MYVPVHVVWRSEPLGIPFLGSPPKRIMGSGVNEGRLFLLDNATYFDGPWM